MTAETALMVPRLVLLAWRELPRRAPARRWLLYRLARVLDANLAEF
jgi:hypothetical protein